MGETAIVPSAPHPEIRLRQASLRDAVAIAELHADSWRRHYRGAYSDSFLDGDVVSDRRAVWVERLTAPGADQFTVVADQSGEVVGFVHMILDADPQWGALLDNLHVIHQHKRSGIGRHLLSEAARQLSNLRPEDSRFYLWVLEQNTAAQAFYTTCGGSMSEAILSEPLPGGGRAPCYRVVWPDATSVAEIIPRSE